MIKKNLKVLLTILLIVIMTFALSSTFVQATDAVVTSETSTDTEATVNAESETTEESEIHNGDLYLFDNKVVMDKLVDGNVFIFGQEVEITGQVNGNLFVCANKITFDNCYIRYSVFACANSIYYNGACNDFYVASNDLEMTYDSYVIRDVKAAASNLTFRAAVGRDADLSFNKADFGEGENIPVVYGDLRYSAPTEATIPEGVITETGTTTYSNSATEDSSSTSVSEIIINFLVCIVTAIAVYLIIRAFIPKFSDKIDSEKLSAKKLLKGFGIGLASIVLFTIIFILLLISQIGLKLAFVLLAIFVLVCLISAPIFAIIVTNELKPVLKLDKKSIFILVLSLVSIILYGVTLIPVIGGIFSFILTPMAIGMLINMFIPHKELTDEEKTAIAEAKKQAKDDKEKLKAERAEQKAAKKQEKLELKEAKKNNKEL